MSRFPIQWVHQQQWAQEGICRCLGSFTRVSHVAGLGDVLVLACPGEVTAGEAPGAAGS